MSGSTSGGLESSLNQRPINRDSPLNRRAWVYGLFEYPEERSLQYSSTPPHLYKRLDQKTRRELQPSRHLTQSLLHTGEHGSGSAVPSPLQATLPPPSAGQWRCPVCTYDNLEQHLGCDMCGSPRTAAESAPETARIESGAPPVQPGMFLCGCFST